MSGRADMLGPRARHFTSPVTFSIGKAKPIVRDFLPVIVITTIAVREG